MSNMLHRLKSDAEGLSGGKHEIYIKNLCDLNILGDDQELYSAFSNLLSNAIRYTPEGGKIIIEWASDHGEPYFCVKDTGPGIAPEHIPRLTERFYRVDRSRSRETGGTGLGMAIVKHVINRHQGELKIESIVGQGSSFYLTFPMQREL